MKTVTMLVMAIIAGLLVSLGVNAQQQVAPVLTAVQPQVQSEQLFRLRMQMDVEMVSSGGQVSPTGQQIVYTSPPGDGDKVMSLWYAELQQLAGCGIGSPDADTGKAANIAESLGNLWTQ